MKKSLFFVFLAVIVLITATVACDGESTLTPVPTPTLVEPSRIEVRDAWARVNPESIVVVCSPGISLVELGAACMLQAVGCNLEAVTAVATKGDISDDCYEKGKILFLAGRIR